MGRWIEVTEGGGEPPRPVRGPVDDGIVLTRGHEIVAHGTANGVPWLLQAFATGPGPGGKWWEHGTVGPEMEFLLGAEGCFGGGGMRARIMDGTHFTMTSHFFGSLPEVVAWVGVASSETDHLEVRLDDGDVRRLELHRTLEGFPHAFWFFPPRGAAGSVVAIGRDGDPLQTERLIDLDVSSDSNAGTSVNSFCYSPDGPPPGWPADDTQYGPGQGPRWAEDFLLHVCPFPLYIVPPDAWEGYTALSGHGGSGRIDAPEEVRFGYVDEPRDARRGFEIVNRFPDRRWRRFEREAREEDVGIWMADRPADDDVLNFADRFVRHEGERGRRGQLDTGPRRYTGRVDVTVAGHPVSVERWEFQDFPSYRRLVVALAGVEIVLHGWDLTEDECLAHLPRLERLQLGTPLFEAMKRAQARSDARLAELHDD
jgi:hypothetical protein